MKSMHFSRKVKVFHGRTAPEEGMIVGYGAIVDALKLPTPLPLCLTLISEKNRKYVIKEWRILTPRYMPVDALYNHLVFALKYEGIDLLVLKKLFERIEKETVRDWIIAEPFGRYSRMLWFLYEWLMEQLLEISDLKEGNYVSLVDEKIQYASSVSVNSNRHRIRNNLPGTVSFCPLIFKTTLLQEFVERNLSSQTYDVIKGIHKDILMRTSAFLLLKDSKASFSIEGENPTPNRALNWGRAIGQAGNRSLSHEEMLRLQEIIIDSNRFVQLGYRKEGGFIGEHDRNTGMPIPDHISARWQDLNSLMNGLFETAVKLETAQFNPVLTAAKIAFGFVFIHPFADGNGRLHRYLIHHLLSKMNFTPQGIIFPISAAILENIIDYRNVLEGYSHPVLKFIEWDITAENNVEVLNATIDYYRYFDATPQAEFLFKCIDYTIHSIIPEEVAYLQNYDAFKIWVNDKFQMPDKMIAMLVRFLLQNKGELSKRRREKEFEGLTEAEVKEIEREFSSIFFTNR
jgi:hypothetical protein